jgi:transposase-like protein
MTSKQNLALTSLLAGRSISSAASVAGVARQTVGRWMRDDADFREALRDGQMQAIERAARLVAAQSCDAVEYFAQVLHNSKNEPALRLKAARFLADAAFKLHETRDLESDVDDLERLVMELKESTKVAK